MIAPALVVGAALLAWGWAGNPLILAVALAAGYEIARAAGPRVTPLRGRERIVMRVALGAAAVIFIGTAATQPFPGAIYLALRGLPVVLFPIVLMQALAVNRTVEAGGRELDATHLFAAIAMIGAAASDPAATWIYPAGLAIAAVALLARARRRAAAAAMIAVAGAVGFGVHTGLSALQARVEDWSTELLQEMFSGGADPFRERTRIGDMGRVKLSDRIALRVLPEGPRPGQILLREASFDSYVNGEWRASRRSFEPRPVIDGAWRMRPGESPRALVIRRAVTRTEGVLALPAGTVRVTALAGAALATMPLGTVRARGLPAFVALHVGYDPAADSAAPPTDADLEVPGLLAPALDQVLEEAGVPRGSAPDAAAAIARFFAAHFGYTLSLSDGRGGSRTLRDFLLSDRKGHCEYFATASALLLRRAGVPARYTVGYSAQEYSALEHAFVVRDRHSHAWTSAWIGGRWVEVDNTPSRWADFEERETRAWYGPLLDLASWAADALRRVFVEAAWDLRAITLAVGSIGLVLALAIGARQLGRRPRRGAARPLHPATSAWRRVEDFLAARGMARAAAETPRAYARRVERASAGAAGLTALADRYYAARFDPASAMGESDAFARDVEGWLDRRAAGNAA